MPNTQPLEIEKLKLTREESQELKIFFMIGRKMFPRPEEKVVAILAYQLEDALNKGRQANPGFNLFFTGQSMTVRELLEKLHSDSVVSPPKKDKEEVKVKEEVSTEKLYSPERISFEQFRTGLLLVADEYVTNPEDQKELKRIISNLEYREKKKIML